MASALVRQKLLQLLKQSNKTDFEKNIEWLIKLTEWINTQCPYLQRALKMTHGMERIPDSLGYLIINEDGAVFASGGELENDEDMAGKMANLLRTALRVPLAMINANFKRITVTWDSFFYAVTISNNKIYVVKRQHLPQEPAIA